MRRIVVVERRRVNATCFSSARSQSNDGAKQALLRTACLMRFYLGWRAGGLRCSCATVARQRVELRRSGSTRRQCWSRTDRARSVSQFREVVAAGAAPGGRRCRVCDLPAPTAGVTGTDFVREPGASGVGGGGDGGVVGGMRWGSGDPVETTAGGVAPDPPVEGRRFRRTPTNATAASPAVTRPAATIGRRDRTVGSSRTGSGAFGSRRWATRALPTAPRSAPTPT